MQVCDRTRLTSNPLLRCKSWGPELSNINWISKIYCKYKESCLQNDTWSVNRQLSSPFQVVLLSHGHKDNVRNTATASSLASLQKATVRILTGHPPQVPAVKELERGQNHPFSYIGCTQMMAWQSWEPATNRLGCLGGGSVWLAD